MASVASWSPVFSPEAIAGSRLQNCSNFGPSDATRTSSAMILRASSAGRASAARGTWGPSDPRSASARFGVGHHALSLAKRRVELVDRLRESREQLDVGRIRPWQIVETKRKRPQHRDARALVRDRHCSGIEDDVEVACVRSQCRQHEAREVVLRELIHRPDEREAEVARRSGGSPINTRACDGGDSVSSTERSFANSFRPDRASS